MTFDIFFEAIATWEFESSERLLEISINGSLLLLSGVASKTIDGGSEQAPSFILFPMGKVRSAPILAPLVVETAWASN